MKLPHTPRERLLFWVDVVTRPVHDSGIANDEPVRIRASDLYNLHQALDAYLANDEDAKLIERLERRIAKAAIDHLEERLRNQREEES